MKKNRHLIKEVLPDSIAAELEITPGDELLSVNGQAVEDIFDYQFLVQDEKTELLIRKPEGEEWLLEIEKEEDEDLGLVFENSPHGRVPLLQQPLRLLFYRSDAAGHAGDPVF